MIAHNRSSGKVHRIQDFLGFSPSTFWDFADADYGNGGPRKPAVDAPGKRHQPVKDPQLEASERSSAEHASVEPPARTCHPIKVECTFHYEASLLHSRP